MLLLLFIHLLVMANEFWVDLIKVNLLVNMIVDARTFFDCAQFTTEKQRSFWNELPKDIFFCSQVTFVCLITYMVVTINFHSNPLIAVEMCVCVSHLDGKLESAAEQWFHHYYCKVTCLALGICLYVSSDAMARNQFSIYELLRLNCIYRSSKWQAGD